MNRQGFPAQIGVDRTTTPYTYKAISIGALDDDHTAGGLERKASYSNMGDYDCFAAADQTLSASDDNSTQGSIDMMHIMILEQHKRWIRR